MKNVILFLIVITCISACDNPKTVSYYGEHPDEMRAKLDECNDDLTKLAKDGNCINARAANKKLFFKPVDVNKNNPAPPVNLFEEK